MTYINHYESPLGGITIASNGSEIIGLWFDEQKYYGSTITPKLEEKSLPIFDETKRWLDIYFSGVSPTFTPSLKISSTPFREVVWKILLTIPFGQTMTYGEIGSIVAKQREITKMSARAVGSAVAHNPISLIIPCHRVIGAKGSLVGYAGGMERKEKLLFLERSRISGNPIR